MSLAPGVAAALTDIVGPRHVHEAPSDRVRDRLGVVWRWDEMPDAVVYPGSATEVARVLRGAVAGDVTVRMGTGDVLRDGDAGQILLDLSRLNEILEIDRDVMIARVQPGVAEDRLFRELTAAGLDLAIVPLAASARPLTACDCVLGVQAVSTAGRVLRVARAMCDDRDDLLELVMRADGTFCVITEVTLALLPNLGG